MKRTRIAVAFLTALLAAGSCFAQNEGAKPNEAPGSKYFRLDFVVKELETGRVINSRAYSTTIATERPAGSSIRTGNRVPIKTGSVQAEVTYIDVGVSIDCNSAKEVQNQLALNVTADVSTIAEDAAKATVPSPPIIRQNKWSGIVLVPLRKATTIFSSDDVSTKRQMQLELTATPIP